MKITSSPAISLTLSLLASGAYLCHGEKPEEPQHGPRLCPTRTSCLDCLRDPFCGSWNNAGGCSDGCASVDGSPCYRLSPSISLAFYGNDETKEDVCARADADQANDAICSKETDCGSCTGTTLSNGVGSCAWYKEGGYCGRPGCALLPARECGDTTCPAPKVEDNNDIEEDSAPPAQEANVVIEKKDCSSHKICLGCMNDPACGSWSLGNGCSADCMANDMSCYKREDNEFASTACMRAVARSSPSEETELDDKTIIMPVKKVDVKIEEKKQKKEKKKKGKKDRLRGRK